MRASQERPLKRRRADEEDEQEEGQDTQVRIYLVSIMGAFINPSPIVYMGRTG
jgi:hypothetical protein